MEFIKKDFSCKFEKKNDGVDCDTDGTKLFSHLGAFISSIILKKL